TITIEDAPESGEALTPIEICEDALTDNSPFDLFTLLDGTQDTNGTWSDINGTVSNPIDITGLTAGTYDYTYSVADIGTCSDVDVVVQIIVLPLPETGVPTPALFCENDLTANSPLDLFGQLAGEDAGGTWSDDDASGALTGSDVDLTTLTIGVYNYSYTITDVNGCTNTSTVTITIEDAPESGTANAPIEFCLAEITTGQTFDLYDLLEGEDQTGTWSDDTPSSQLSGSILTLDGLASGTYNFTYDVTAIGTCDDNLVSVSVIINDTLAPTVVTPQVFCDEATVADLFGTGTNIQWYDQVTNGVVLEATTPLVDGVTYYATQTDASTGCESSTRAAVTVTINQSPNSGNPNATGISVCNDNTSIDLNTGLDGTQDSGGVWQDTDGTGGLSGNIFDATGIAAGTYNFTYVVTGTAPCTDSSTTIQVVLSAPLNPGTDATLDVCSTNGTTDLFTLIGTADVGGTWSPALNSGTGVFDPLVDADGTYTYVLTNACGNYTSEVVVTVTPAPNAGTDGTFTICAIDVDATNSQLDLLTILNDTPDTTGTFTNNDNANGFSGTLLDLTQVTAGNYTFTYTVNANSPCTVNATAVATVVINDSDAPTVIDANPSFCLVDSPTVSNLDAFVNGTTINWYDDAALTILLDASEALIDGEDYYATQTGTSACESSANVMINVSVNDEQTPTLIDSNLELCINDAPTINELTLNISEYNSNTNNVVWYTTETGGTPLSNSDDLSINTTYYAALVNATTGCESSVRLEVSPDLTGCGILAIPDGFSPNGDGTNDTFDIDNLDVLYPDFQIEIYNRNGNIVYRGNASTPRFDGTSNESSIGKGDLPVGVYFYIFNFNDGVNKPKQGRLYLSR
ncbi:T9SS type B sorting domain-containing protein, partial [Lacinutrix salivirga]